MIAVANGRVYCINVDDISSVKIIHNSKVEKNKYTVVISHHEDKNGDILEHTSNMKTKVDLIDFIKFIYEDEEEKKEVITAYENPIKSKEIG